MLLLNIGLLGVIIILINQALLAVLPYPWGEEDFNVRFEHYLANQEAYNTLFVGSSRTYRHIDPAVFDQEMAAGSERTHSFNLGVPANSFPKTAVTVKQILAHNPDGLQTILFELTPFSIGWMQEDNYLTRRQIYWVDVDTLLYQLRSMWQSDTALGGKIRNSGLQIATLIHKYSNFGLGDDILDYYLTDNFRDGRYLGPGGDGFYSLETAMETGKEENRRIWSQRRGELLANPRSLSEGAELNRLAFDEPASMRELTVTQVKKLAEMQDLAEEQGVTLYYYLPPRMNDRAYRSLMPVYFSLDPGERLNLGDPGQNPEFYSLANSFDMTHLNDKGAREFTQVLARKLMALGRKETK